MQVVTAHLQRLLDGTCQAILDCDGQGFEQAASIPPVHSHSSPATFFSDAFVTYFRAVQTTIKTSVHLHTAALLATAHFLGHSCTQDEYNHQYQKYEE